MSQPFGASHIQADKQNLSKGNALLCPQHSQDGLTAVPSYLALYKLLSISSEADRRGLGW